MDLQPALTCAVVAPLPLALWPGQLQRLRKARIRVVASHVAAEDFDPWLALVRQAGLLPGALCSLVTCDLPWLVARQGKGPMIVVLEPLETDTRDNWQAFVNLIAGLIDPHMRFAALPGPLCLRGDWRPDVHLDLPLIRHFPCDPCTLSGSCPGPLAPTQGLRPRPQPVSNQFDLVEAATGQIELVDGRQYHCDSEQWGMPEVQTAVGRGQLYLDQSTKARLDDFAEDLRLIERTPSGQWQPSATPPFAAEEAELRSILCELLGIVVDIGVGPLRYLDMLAPMIATGAIRYLGIEPDLRHLLAIAPHLPGAVWAQGYGEALPLPDACADAVLMLRSVNHLHDLDAGLAQAARVLRPGGQLLLVDNVTFGLLRTTDQRARAHAIPVSVTPFEHFRNDDASEVLARLPQDWPVLRQRSVQPGGSNQWLLLLRKPGPVPLGGQSGVG